MRGSPVLMDAWEFGSGIIPAHAGLTFVLRYVCRSHRDHPRACGAHVLVQCDRPLARGSSPRMRGSRMVRSRQSRMGGIIPAHAGLTWRHSRRCSAPRDHPRACGAHLLTTYRARSRRGSSPRMRGSRSCVVVSRRHAGIIPAHAGLTDFRVGMRML